MALRSEVFGAGEVQSGRFLVQTALPRTEVENPPAKGGTSFKFPVQVFVPASRSQVNQGASKEDLIVECLCPNFPKLGMVDPGTGAGGGGWKGIEGEDEEMAFHSSRGCSATRTRLQEPAGVLDRDPAASRECHLLQRQSLNFFPPLSSLALTLCRCSLKTAGPQPNQNKIPPKHICGGKHRSHIT